MSSGRIVPTALRVAVPALLVLLAVSAQASEVVEVRVGRHPTFTRVVFELDMPAGYRVERPAGSDARDTIVVTLDARSAARSVRSKSQLVESVSIGQERGRTVARIGLRKTGLRLKEMILAKPPRIVLDVMAPPEVASAEPEPRPAEKSESEAPREVPEAGEEPEAPVEPERSEPPAPEPEPEHSVEFADEAPSDPESGSDSPAAAAETEAMPEAELAQRAAPAPPPAAAPEPPRAVPPAAQPRPPVAVAEPPGSGPSWKLLAGAAGGVLAVVLIVLFVMRRRSGRDDHDVLPLDAFPAEPVDAGEGFAFEDREQEDLPAPQTGRPGSAASGLFDDDDDEKGDEVMEPMETHYAGMDAGPVAPVSADGDLARIVGELERRLAQAETRLEETGETCERLERQVAAQAEELRVQRAASARTQRALRSLSRSEEEQATEPALRER